MEGRERRRNEAKDEKREREPGEVTWIHAGGWSPKPTPLAVTLCYGGGEKRGRGREESEREQQTLGTVLYASMHFACTIKNFISSPEVGPHEIHLFTFHPNSVFSHFDFLEFCFPPPPLFL